MTNQELSKMVEEELSKAMESILSGLDNQETEIPINTAYESVREKYASKMAAAKNSAASDEEVQEVINRLNI